MPIGSGLVGALVSAVLVANAAGTTALAPHPTPPASFAGATARAGAVGLTAATRHPSGVGVLGADWPAGPRLPDEPTAGRWAWPLDPRPGVVRRFDLPDQPWLPGHRGVDLAASVGQHVTSPTSGVVAWRGVVAGRGVVVVRHDGGLRSTFEPVTGAPHVGALVARGDVIGALAPTPGHCAPRACLHWGVLRGETYLDPLAFVGRARIILLPLP